MNDEYNVKLKKNYFEVLGFIAETEITAEGFPDWGPIDILIGRIGFQSGQIVACPVKGRKRALNLICLMSFFRAHNEMHLPIRMVYLTSTLCVQLQPFSAFFFWGGGGG